MPGKCLPTKKACRHRQCLMSVPPVSCLTISMSKQPCPLSPMSVNVKSGNATMERPCPWVGGWGRIQACLSRPPSALELQSTTDHQHPCQLPVCLPPLMNTSQPTTLSPMDGACPNCLALILARGKGRGWKVEVLKDELLPHPHWNSLVPPCLGRRG